MELTKISIKLKQKEEEPNLLASAEITLNDVFVVHGIKIVKVKEKLIVKMPYRNSKTGKPDNIKFYTGSINLNDILIDSYKIHEAKKILLSLLKLNKIGCKKAVERVEELTEIQKYLEEENQKGENPEEK